MKSHEIMTNLCSKKQYKSKQDLKMYIYVSINVIHIIINIKKTIMSGKFPLKI